MKKQSFFRTFSNAYQGIKYVLKSERNFRIHLLALVINIFLIIFLEVKGQDMAIILLVSGLVLSLEMMNTAVEKISDVVSPQYDERIGLIKDISAGAVFVAAIFALIIGIITYAKYICR